MFKSLLNLSKNLFKKEVINTLYIYEIVDIEGVEKFKNHENFISMVLEMPVNLISYCNIGFVNGVECYELKFEAINDKKYSLSKIKFKMNGLFGYNLSFDYGNLLTCKVVIDDKEYIYPEAI